MDIEIIYGPPGTGKTTTLLGILEKEMKTISPERIAYVSFTKKGTYEGRDRAKERFMLTNEDLPYFRTIHSLAFRAMSMNKNEMISKEHYKKFSNAMGMNFTGYYTEDLVHDDDKYLFFGDLYRNNKKIGEELSTELNPRVLKWVTNNYKKFKEAVGIYDFTDLLELYLEEGKSFPVDVAIIDEAQDLTSLQWQFIWKAFMNAKKVYIAGDDDQAIYEWSGADIEYFLDLKGNQNTLSKSWRLPRAIHNYAAKIADTIDKRIPKEFIDNGTVGLVEKINNFKDVTIDNENSWLFLSRNNYHLGKIENWLKDKALVYEKRGKLSVNYDLVKAINAHSNLMKGKEITDNERLLLQFYMEGSPTSFENPWFDEFVRLKEDTVKYYRDLVANKTDLTKCNIKLNTIHGSKGGEADNVVLLLGFNKRVAINMEKNFDSEMRCYYVGVTRAKRNLYLVLPETDSGYPCFV